MPPRPALVVALAAALVGFGAAPASAHAMRMRVTVTATEIVVRTTYSGDDHDGGDVTARVLKPDKSVIAEGKIGKDGVWRTPVPPAGEYAVVAEDDFGHRAEQKVVIGADAPPEPEVYRANEPPVPSGIGIAAGIGMIGLATAGGYWWMSRKKG